MSALDEGEWSALRAGRFILRERVIRKRNWSTGFRGLKTKKLPLLGDSTASVLTLLSDSHPHRLVGCWTIKIECGMAWKVLWVFVRRVVSSSKLALKIIFGQRECLID